MYSGRSSIILGKGSETMAGSGSDKPMYPQK